MNSITAVLPLSHLTSHTPTKSNLHCTHHFTTVFTNPDIYRLLAFQVPNFMSIGRPHSFAT